MSQLHGHVLAVDDDPEVLALTAMILRARGYAVHTEESADAAVMAASALDFDVVLTDLHLDGSNGLDLCTRLLTMRPALPIILLTGDGTMKAAVGAMRAGAFDYVTKPVDGELLVLTIERAIKLHRLESEVIRLREEAAGSRRGGEILGSSAGIAHVLDVISRIASTTASVLITGESGTGKELVARAVHDHSQRARGPFIALNCAALPHELLESELFGHTRGAFTDAKNARKGLFLEAHGGTLFLDEIGEMPLATQVKLLRALQERAVRPVGGSGEIAFDARVIAATNRDLSADVANKNFREDLYYRINVVTIHVPPLRQRPDDIPILAESFLRRFAAQQHKAVASISPAAMQRLVSRRWPGNVRELENAIERAVSMARTDSLNAQDFATDAPRAEVPPPALERVVETRAAPAASMGRSLPATLEGLVTAEIAEQQYVQHVLSMVGGNRSRAAEVLGYDRRTLHRKLRRAAGPAAPATSQRAARPTGDELRVLIVDADIDARQLLQIALRASGHAVTTAGDLATALASGAMDVVLTDLALPDGAGSTLVDHARGAKVLALSTQRPPTSDRFDAWIGKPAPAAEVLTAIDRVLGRGHFAR